MKLHKEIQGCSSFFVIARNEAIFRYRERIVLGRLLSRASSQRRFGCGDTLRRKLPLIPFRPDRL